MIFTYKDQCLFTDWKYLIVEDRRSRPITERVVFILLHNKQNGAEFMSGVMKKKSFDSYLDTWQIPVNF